MAAITTVIGLAANGVAHAESRTISAQADAYDCGPNKPGDVLTLTPGPRGPLKISNCEGTKANPIIIRNDPSGSGPTVIRRSSGGSGGWIFNCMNCVGVVIDGSYKWKGAPGGKTYGIQITMTGGQGPSAFLRMGGLSRNFTIRNVEIDGAWPRLSSNGSGIRVNDHDINRSKYSGLWREGILIENNFIHDIRNSGMYIGPNYNDGDIPLRNVEIRNNVVEDTGFEGIHGKSWWEGNNSIHHNVVRRAGKTTTTLNESSQYSGIKIMAGTGKIFSNWVEATGQHGIVSWTQEGPKASEGRGPFNADIWNNVIVDAGSLWKPFMQNAYGISVGAQSGTEKPVPHVYNNTIVNARQGGIIVTSNVSPGFVRDNILAGTGGNPVLKAPSYVDLVNNRIGAVTQMGFVNPSQGNYRLTIGSPARNDGSNVFPDNDFAGVLRPKEGSADQGAFEGSGN